jgi:hypothetical protein
MYATSGDGDNERDVRARLGQAWHCEVYPFGMFTRVDSYAIRAGSLLAVVEIKCRTIDVAEFATTFLTVRKWASLTDFHQCLDVPALYAVRWLDALGWVDIAGVDTRRHSMSGAPRRPNLPLEPQIEIPIEAFTFL